MIATGLRLWVVRALALLALLSHGIGVAGAGGAHHGARAAVAGGAPGGLAIEICTAEGLRTVHLLPDGQEAPANQAPLQHGSACPLCPAGAAPLALPPPAAPRLATPAPTDGPARIAASAALPARPAPGPAWPRAPPAA